MMKEDRDLSGAKDFVYTGPSEAQDDDREYDIASRRLKNKLMSD